MEPLVKIKSPPGLSNNVEGLGIPEICPFSSMYSISSFMLRKNRARASVLPCTFEVETFASGVSEESRAPGS